MGDSFSEQQAVAALFGRPDRREPELAEFAAQTNSRAPMPTAEAYGVWHAAFTFFNERLFQGKLPNCLITLTRHPRALGYFCAGAFQDRDGAVAHEISMNPSWFEARGDDASYSTLVHEMCHLHRHVFGKANRKGGKGRGGYHDSVWADQMESVGLMPSNTGAPGGRRIGFRMTHYIIEDGRFDRACREFLISGHVVNWRDARIKRPDSPIERGPAATPATAPRNTRTRFVCKACDVRAWSRASARLACAACNLPLIAR